MRRLKSLALMLSPGAEKKLPFILIFILGLAAGFLLERMYKLEQKSPVVYLKRLGPANGDLVNPLLQIDVPQGGDVKLESIKYSLREYIERCASSGNAARIAVYLKDLNSGSWIGINEKENFVAASLLKLPLLIAYLKEAQKAPETLSKKIKYEAKISAMPQNVLPEIRAQEGNTYTVDELLYYMIAYSDNTSKDLLIENIDLKSLNRVYLDLQLAVPKLEGDYETSAEGFATFLQVLYNSTYLNAENSERALFMLTKTGFPRGIVAGVPVNIPVAHKFGERRYTSGGVQLHDCGIVYYPKNPYLLCVMTKDGELGRLEEIIKDISRIVYDQENKKVMVMF